MQCVLSKDGILSVEASLSQTSITSSEAIFPIKSSPVKSLDMATPVKNPIITEADGSRKLRLQVSLKQNTGNSELRHFNYIKFKTHLSIKNNY